MDRSAAQELADRLPPPADGQTYSPDEICRLAGTKRSTLRKWCNPADGWLREFSSKPGREYRLAPDGVRKILLEPTSRMRNSVEDRARLILLQLDSASAHPSQPVLPTAALDQDAAAENDPDTGTSQTGARPMNDYAVQVQRLQARLDGALARAGQLQDEVAKWKRIAHRNDAAMLEHRANWREFHDVDPAEFQGSQANRTQS